MLTLGIISLQTVAQWPPDSAGTHLQKHQEELPRAEDLLVH